MNRNPKPISDAELVGMMQRNQKALRERIEQLEAENAKLHAELERRESHWFSLVMNCAAELETASYCMTDTAAKRVAQSGADHYRKQANAAPSAPKADDPVKQMLLEALGEIAWSNNSQWQADRARAAIAAARKEDGKV